MVQFRKAQPRTEGSWLCCKFVVCIGLDMVAWPSNFFFFFLCWAFLGWIVLVCWGELWCWVIYIMCACLVIKFECILHIFCCNKFIIDLFISCLSMLMLYVHSRYLASLSQALGRWCIKADILISLHNENIFMILCNSFLFHHIFLCTLCSRFCKLCIILLSHSDLALLICCIKKCSKLLPVWHSGAASQCATAACSAVPVCARIRCPCWTTCWPKCCLWYRCYCPRCADGSARGSTCCRWYHTS